MMVPIEDKYYLPLLMLFALHLKLIFNLYERNEKNPFKFEQQPTLRYWKNLHLH